MAQATLLDIAKLNGNDKVVGLIEENLNVAPEARLFPARSIRGTSFTTVTRTAYPGVGFRAANAGSTPTKSSFVKKLVECYILSGVIKVDKAVAQAYEDGPSAWEMIEASGVMRQALIELGQQIFYGVTTDANGFPGLKAAVPFGSTISVNSGGSDATVQSSLYAVKFGPQDCQLVLGNNASWELSDFADQLVTDDSGTTYYPARVSSLTAWTGLQIGSVNSVGRIMNIGADTETGDTLTDAKIAQLLQKFPVGVKPDAMFCSRRSLSQLQRSRTQVLNANGASKSNIENVADIPASSFGIPIYATDSILDTDAVES